ncbi:response regulator [Sphingobacterium phlebotomi]|uniref:histidine kinase n=1 Tax=Sphingobacterium phlebotomi TaxID=2605433 RepID=A0A5D4H9F7_9SPHI|nr:two-component regulator propeller domain-containing protein [Sphingobacterium phlebotomi]TYR37257.1 response regulator [Sphingobacterium phlebotomi]
MKYASLIVFLLLCIATHVFGQDIHFRKITANHGLSHNTVYAITQDENGFIWFGTREGLNRYDSYQIKNYYIESSKIGGSANRISSLYSYKSFLYVGTDDGLYIYDSHTDQLQKSELIPSPLNILFVFGEKEDIYVGTARGLYKLRNNKSELLSGHHMAKAMCAIAENRFLLAIGNSLTIIDRNGTVQKTFTRTSLAELAQDSYIFNIYKDKNEHIWLATNRGLFTYDIKNQEFSKLKFSYSETPENNTVRSVSGNKKDMLYIGTEEGLYIYNLKTGHAENYQQSFHNDPKKLSDNAIYSTYFAKDGSVWLGTYFGGVNYMPSNTYGFRSIRANDREQGLTGKAVSQMMEDSERKIWIGTEDGGITIYDPADETYQTINKQSSPFYLTTNNVHAIHDDGYGNIWVGTFLGGLHQFDIQKNTTTVYLKKQGDPNSLSNDQVYAIYRDSRGKLWIATQNGLNLFDYQTKKFSLFKPEIMQNIFIYDIIEDKNNDLWFCTRQSGIYRYRPSTDDLIRYTTTSNEPAIRSNQIISVYQDRKQQLWFGTLDGGVCLYNPEQNEFRSYTIEDGLPNNNVYGILEDKEGIIWLTTNRGISRLDPKTNKFTNYDSKHGLPSNQFNFKSYLKSSADILYFGSINGLCFFDPSTVENNHASLPLMFTDFQLFNKSIVPQESAILKNQINDTKRIKLAYNQNVFTISYAAINYANPGSTDYAYYLEGFEDKWNHVGNKNSVTYTNLSPGNYVFHIKALNAAGRARSAERTMEIYVAPPFYRSHFAYFVYFLLVVAVIWMYTKFVKFLDHKKLEIQLERVEKEKMKELTQHRLNFFTFISHEFKTPLTLILASIDKFLENTSSDFKKSTELSTVKNNASILFKLIQQLMEFRKIESDHASINLSKSDVVDFIRKATHHFETIAVKKNIDLTFVSTKPLLECYFDQDKMEKILFNILSNAMKNTLTGSIDVALDFGERNDVQQLVTIRVNDTGRGMSTTELKNIFNPFYKSGANKTDAESSGIGLALVDSLVKYLNGEIHVKSVQDMGTSVKITMPVLIRLDHVPKTEQISELPEKTVLIKQERLLDGASISKDAKTKYTLLIVEDNRELMTFLSKHFSRHYEVVNASNGLLAIKKINKIPPDIIISDVKMPKMDGIELCNWLKSDERFNYIPIILLSDSSIENIKIDGLDVGADAYVSKPFNLKELELLVNNMVKSRVKLREHVISLGAFKDDTLPSNNKDQAFLSRLSEILEKEFANPTLTIEDIANELNTSRTSLHLNLKRVLDKNATELLNEYRLKKAIIMLENDMPISEVAYHCGYSDPNYFGRVFKKYYGQTPLRYKRKE